MHRSTHTHTQEQTEVQIPHVLFLFFLYTGWCTFLSLSRWKSSPVTQFTASGLVGIKAENEFSACLACLLLVMRFSGLCDHAERKSVLYKLFVELTFIDHFREILLFVQPTHKECFSHIHKITQTYTERPVNQSSHTLVLRQGEEILEVCSRRLVAGDAGDAGLSWTLVR